MEVERDVALMVANLGEDEVADAAFECVPEPWNGVLADDLEEFARKAVHRRARCRMSR